MSRYIDADALLEDIRKNSESYFADDFAHEWVDKQPTADVVEVVRCKDCVYYHPSYCEVWSKYGTVQTREQGYCYLGMHKYIWCADMKGETNG